MKTPEQPEQNDTYESKTLSYKELVSHCESEMKVKEPQLKSLFRKTGWDPEGEWTITASSEKGMTLGKVGSNKEYRIGIQKMKVNKPLMEAIIRKEFASGRLNFTDKRRCVILMKLPDDDTIPTRYMPYVKDITGLREEIHSVFN